MWERWVSTVADREVELLGDLGVGVAQRDQPQDLRLALAQPIGRATRTRWRRRYARRELSVEVAPALDRGLDGRDQLLVGGLLEHVPGGARPGCFEGQVTGPPALRSRGR